MAKWLSGRNDVLRRQGDSSIPSDIIYSSIYSRRLVSGAVCLRATGWLAGPDVNTRIIFFALYCSGLEQLSLGITVLSAYNPSSLYGNSSLVVEFDVIFEKLVLLTIRYFLLVSKSLQAESSTVK
jgi:hypothetical protein